MGNGTVAEGQDVAGGADIPVGVAPGIDAGGGGFQLSAVAPTAGPAQDAIVVAGGIAGAIVGPPLGFIRRLAVFSGLLVYDF